MSMSAGSLRSNAARRCAVPVLEGACGEVGQSRRGMCCSALKGLRTPVAARAKSSKARANRGHGRYKLTAFFISIVHPFTTFCQELFIHSSRLFIGHKCPSTNPKSEEYSPPLRARSSFGVPAFLG
jgi:hypothetical protein